MFSIISPKANWGWISVFFAFNFEIIFSEILLAKVAMALDSFSGFSTLFFGIIIMCPREIGFMSKTAMADLSSSIFLEGISPETIERKIG